MSDVPCVVAVLVLIQQEGKYLLIRESKAECRNTWFLPGGRASAGEAILDAAVREVREETGLSVELTGLLFIDQASAGKTGGRADRIRFVFLGNATGGTLKRIEDEHSICAGWFPEEEIGKLALRSPFVLKTIELAGDNPAVLPISKIHVLTPEEYLQERP